jgi:hypothetical protein
MLALCVFQIFLGLRDQLLSPRPLLLLRRLFLAAVGVPPLLPALELRGGLP